MRYFIVNCFRIDFTYQQRLLNPIYTLQCGMNPLFFFSSNFMVLVMMSIRLIYGCSMTMVVLRVLGQNI